MENNKTAKQQPKSKHSNKVWYDKNHRVLSVVQYATLIDEITKEIKKH
jgi:hypothetical protein